jgi:hypothetical protein
MLIRAMLAQARMEFVSFHAKKGMRIWNPCVTLVSLKKYRLQLGPGSPASSICSIL